MRARVQLMAATTPDTKTMKRDEEFEILAKTKLLLEKIRDEEDVTVVFRVLRNWCSLKESNRIGCKEIVVCCFTEKVNLLRNNFVAWQFIANATVSRSICKVFRNYINIVEEIVQSSDENTINAVYMCIHNCFKCFNYLEISEKLFCGVIDNIHQEFPLIVAEDIAKSSGKFYGNRLEEFLQILNNHPLVHSNISAKFLGHVTGIYKRNIDDVLQSKIDPEKITLTQSATEFLSIVAPRHQQLQDDKALLTSLTYLLKMMEESECCQPKRSIEDLKKMGQQDGVVNLKCDLIKLLTSLCHQNSTNQNFVYECGLVPVILNNMRYDARNPFIREACIHCIKILCENNQNVQQFISQVSVLGSSIDTKK